MRWSGGGSGSSSHNGRYGFMVADEAENVLAGLF